MPCSFYHDGAKAQLATMMEKNENAVLVAASALNIHCVKGASQTTPLFAPPDNGNGGHKKQKAASREHRFAQSAKAALTPAQELLKRDLAKLQKKHKAMGPFLKPTKMKLVILLGGEAGAINRNANQPDKLKKSFVDCGLTSPLNTGMPDLMQMLHKQSQYSGASFSVMDVEAAVMYTSARKTIVNAVGGHKFTELDFDKGGIMKTDVEMENEELSRQGRRKSKDNRSLDQQRCVWYNSELFGPDRTQLVS